MKMVTAHAQNETPIRYVYQGWVAGFGAKYIYDERVRRLATPSGNNVIF
jgi:hypothetical protein